MNEELNIRTEGIENFYDVGEEIGSGQFAVVKRLNSKSTGKTFAAKFMKKKRSKALKRGMTREQFIREADVLRSIDHKGIIYLHDVFEFKLEFVLVLELLSGGELFEFLSEQEFLTEDEAVGFLKQVIEAMEYLHSKNIVHLDIKPENIVLKEEKSNHIKLIDFGLARKLTPGEMVREIMGTPEFVAPEIIAFETIGTETDMWAIGVLTYIMLSGASPFLGDDVNETFSNISMVDYEFDDEYFKDISEPAKDFISTLLVKNTRERMSAPQCLQHDWMQDLDEQDSCNSSDDDDIGSIPEPSKKKVELKKRRSTMIKTDAFKAFTARARWQKSLNKVIAISRLALLGKKNGPIQRNATNDDKPLDTQNTEVQDGRDNNREKIEKCETKSTKPETKSTKLEMETIAEEEKVLRDSLVSEKEDKGLKENQNNVDNVDHHPEKSRDTSEEIKKDISEISSDGILRDTSISELKNDPKPEKGSLTCQAHSEVKPVLPDSKQVKQVEPDTVGKTSTFLIDNENRLPIQNRKPKDIDESTKIEHVENRYENKHVVSSKQQRLGGRRASDETSKLQETHTQEKNDTTGRKTIENGKGAKMINALESEKMPEKQTIKSIRDQPLHSLARGPSDHVPNSKTRQTTKSSEEERSTRRKNSKDFEEKDGSRIKRFEDSGWLIKTQKLSTNKERKEPMNIKRGFASTKAEILKWEQRCTSGEQPPRRSFNSLGTVAKDEQQRRSLPRITRMQQPESLDVDLQRTRHSIDVTDIRQRRRDMPAPRDITTGSQGIACVSSKKSTSTAISAENVAIDSLTSKKNGSTSNRMPTDFTSEKKILQTQSVKRTNDCQTISDQSNDGDEIMETNRSSVTLSQTSKSVPQTETAIIDEERRFVIRASLLSQDSEDSELEARSIDEEEEIHGAMGFKSDVFSFEDSKVNSKVIEGSQIDGGKETSNSERKISTIHHKLGQTEMEGFPELSLTLQKSPTSPLESDKDDFVWVVTTEKNKRRDFLSRVLAPRVQAAKESSSPRDVFEKRRIKHKPVGEKGPPRIRRASQYPGPVTSKTEVRVRHKSAPAEPQGNDKHVPTVQLSSNMPAVNFKIQMGEIRLSDP